ncbi:MAG TPA: type 4a pilus biogenesis protein PilO [Gemmatimonadales bacterium]|nr:type 4a pilus biogenesis protein PilO [Gemmatimonadales bacterium]
MALGEKEKKQLLAIAIVAAVGVGVLFWMYWRAPRVAEAAAMRVRIDSLQARVDSARKDLASGTVEALRRRVREYEGSLRLMRQLVPTGAEVPSLIDDVNARAKRRGVQIGNFAPQAVEPGNPFETHRYDFSVVGHYDEVGEFLSDVASLSRIMVPYDVAVNRANETVAQTYGDTTGALLVVNFKLRTFVKPAGMDSVVGGVP